METWVFNEEKDELRWQSLYSGTPPLIYIHGLGCASSSDYPGVVVSPYYLKFSSWLIDMPGAGFSDKPYATIYDGAGQSSILQAWINHTGAATVNIFGHSAGAFIALRLASMIPTKLGKLILCSPGLNEYGVAFLQDITAMNEAEFITTGFDQLMIKLKEEGNNNAWLGAFQICSPQAIYQWASSALADNETDWLEALAALNIIKGVILPDSATTEEIERYLQAGCLIELVPNSGHMMAYDNPNGLAAAISRLMRCPLSGAPAKSR